LRVFTIFVLWLKSKPFLTATILTVAVERHIRDFFRLPKKHIKKEFHNEIYKGIIHSITEIYQSGIDADSPNRNTKEFTQIPKRELIRAQK